jgi:molecular chaperone DnaK
MSGKPLAEAKKAAESFLSQCDLTTTSIGLISFSDRVHLDLKASQNGKEIERAIQNLSIGHTGYGNGDHPFRDIYQLLSNVTGLRYAITLADGVWSCQRDAIAKAKHCHAAEIQVIAISFGGADKKFLAEIASTSDQSIFTDLGRLTETFSTIARELTESGSQGIKGGRRLHGL